MGIILDEEEQEVWARANTYSVQLDEIDLDAVLAEHTVEPEANEPDGRKIPAANYERALSVLDRYVSNDDQRQLAAPPGSTMIAQAIRETIDNSFWSPTRSANNPSA